jgi:hypothetical protein
MKGLKSVVPSGKYAVPATLQPDCSGIAVV